MFVLFRSLLTLSLLLTSACKFKSSSNAVFSESGVLEGRVALFSSLPGGVPCAAGKESRVELVKLDDSGAEEKVTDVTLSADGRFQIAANFLDGGAGDGKRFILRALLCNDDVRERIVTGRTGQDLTLGSTYVTYVVQRSGKLSKTKPRELVEIMNTVPTVEDATEFVSQLGAGANATIKAKLDVDTSNLAEAAPNVRLVTIPMTIDESVESTFRIKLVHWNAAYKKAVQWNFEGAAVGTSETLALTPHANQQGVRSLELIVGQQQSADPTKVDTSKASYSRTFLITVANTKPPVPPNASFISANGNVMRIALDTGANKINCESFSRLAITESSTKPSAGSFTIECTTATSQTVSYTLQSTSNGMKTIYVWAQDGSGNIYDPKTFLVEKTASGIVGRTSGALTATSGTSLSVTYGSTGTQTVTLRNTSSATITGISLSGVESPWALSATTCSTTLEGNANCVVTYTFTSPGEISSTVGIAISYNGGSTTVELSASGIAKSATLSPAYTGYTRWNEWLSWTDKSKDAYSQTTLSECSDADVKVGNCLHTGELRYITLDGLSSCENIWAEDAYDNFDWACVLVNGVPTMRMLGLAPEGRLGQVLNSGSFKSNLVTVYLNETAIYKTDSSVWWTNTVEELTDNPTAVVSLSTQYMVYVRTTIRTSGGFNVAANNVTIVTTENARITWDNVAPANCDANGAVGNVNKVLICAGAVSHLWVEASINAYGTPRADYGIFLKGAKRAVIRKSAISRAASRNILTDGMVGGLIKSVSVADSAKGIELANTTHTVLTELTANNHQQYGIDIDSSSSNVVVTRAQLNNNVLAGARSQSARTTFHLINAINNSGEGLLLSGDRQTVSQLLAVNNGGSGLYLNGSNYKVANSASSNNTTNSLYVGPLASTGAFSDNLLVRAVAGDTCLVDPGATSPGISGNCASSAANVITLQSAPSFDGLVTSDTTNLNNDLGKATTVTDFLGFSSRTRNWGPQTTSILDAAAQGRCTTNCQIWDYAISSSDNTIRNKSANGFDDNEYFTQRETCPSGPIEPSTKILTDNQSTAITYLLNAAEIIGDNLGNDNGLCESNEGCLYQRNFGSYLGAGEEIDYVSCTFPTGGTISGVKLYQFDTTIID